MTTNNNSRDTVIHLVAGGIAGTAGAIATCPLEVVKTRMQSSSNNFDFGITSSGVASARKSVYSEQRRHAHKSSIYRRLCASNALTFSDATSSRPHGGPPSLGLVQCLRQIIENEGPKSLFKGLIPNIIGVAPSRAIYFCAYSQAKKFFNTVIAPDTAVVHICSASCAGFAASSATNPIWFVKTRLQLDNNKNGRTLKSWDCIKRIYKQSGVLGFYKGISASYFGISETVIHFVIYEYLKARLMERKQMKANGEPLIRSSRDFVEFMIAGAISKTIASCAAYPHEVARTRLREEGTKYRNFWQTLMVVYEEEGQKGLYRGLSIQLIRQIPNTAIMMATYEAVVYLLTTYFNQPEIAKPADVYYQSELEE